MKILLVVLSIWFSTGDSLDINFQAPIPSLFAGLIKWMGKSNYIKIDIFPMRLPSTKNDKTKPVDNELHGSKKNMDKDKDKNNMSHKEPKRKFQRRSNALLRAF